MDTMMLPQRDLVRFIYDEYYVKRKPREAVYMSEYWRAYSDRFDVRMDDCGNFVSFKGIGFGDMVARNPITKLLAYLCHLTHLAWLPQRWSILKLIGPARHICKRMGIYFSFDCFKTVCCLELILRHLPDAFHQKRLNIMVIGDGYGYLSSLIKAVLPHSTIVLVDIGKTLLFQSVYCQRAHPTRRHAGIHVANVDPTVDFLYCPSEALEQIDGTFDLVINIASMQEMDVSSVGRYFRFLRAHCQPENRFYCCNRALKVLPGGQVLDYAQYPWQAHDVHLLDEPCAWYRYFFSLRRTAQGPKIFGCRVPLINYLDGIMLHRVTVLATAPKGASLPGSSR